MWLMLAKNWKPIVVGIVILALCGALIGFGMKYQGLKDAEIKLKADIVTLEGDVSERDNKIDALKVTTEMQKFEIDEYVRVLHQFQQNKDDLLVKYNDIMEKIKNAKIPTVDGVIIDDYIIIPSGVPVSASALSTSGTHKSGSNP